MKALTFRVHLLEPVLVTHVGGGDPNSAATFDFIPGSVIRGVLIAQYLQGKPGDAADHNFRSLFLDGSVRFLNAYPETVRGERTLPTPLSWHVEKGEQEPIYDFAVVRDADPRKTWKGVGQSFCHLWEEDENTGEGRAEFYEADIQVNIHTAREDRQKVTAGEATLFRYQALATGQTFCGVILADDPSVLGKIDALLSDESVLSLGGSHLAGYGRVRMERRDVLNTWAEYQPVGDETERIIVTLLSDAVVRDSAKGGYVTTLEPILGLRHQQAFVQTRVVGGFNRTWNLPLLQTLAIRAGSVFVYGADQGLLGRLQAMATTGIGERRAEGFGRVAINWHRVANIAGQQTYVSPPQAVAVRGDSENLARLMVERMLRAELDQTLVKAVNSLSIQRQPQNTQLSRLRVVAQQALYRQNAGVIIIHLNGMRKTAADQLQCARVIGDPLRTGASLGEWLKALAEDLPGIWGLLAVRSDRLPSVGGIRPALTEALALEYTMRLIDGVLRKALKEASHE